MANFCVRRRCECGSRIAGLIPVQRSTTYQTLRVFDQEPSEPEPSWDGDRFGSYGTLIASPEFRFRDRR
jgi:hypothetical protein